MRELGARYVAHGAARGLNVARNTGVSESRGELVVFVDDDIEARPGWLAALLAAAREHPDVDVFTGPIRPRLEGSAPRGCGREGPPITALRLGDEDTDARYAWGANMAIRRSALERVGPFDVGLEKRRRRAGMAGPAAPLAGRWAGPLHRGRRRRPSPQRPTTRGCARSPARPGPAARAARRFDAWRGEAPTLRRELLTLGGCVGHVVRRRCPAGIVDRRALERPA